MDLFVEIVYVLITIVLVMVVLLQAGKGGGMGSALGGGASQSVFGGGGGADFLAKLTQGLAIGFMVCAVYLAYASTHAGSDRLQDMSEDLEADKNLAGEDDEVNYERVGPNPLELPAAGSAPTKSAAPAAVEAAPPVEAPVEEPAVNAPAADAPAGLPIVDAIGEPDAQPVELSADGAAPTAADSPGEGSTPAAKPVKKPTAKKPKAKTPKAKKPAPEEEAPKPEPAAAADEPKAEAPKAEAPKAGPEAAPAPAPADDAAVTG